MAVLTIKFIKDTKNLTPAAAVASYEILFFKSLPGLREDFHTVYKTEKEARDSISILRGVPDKLQNVEIKFQDVEPPYDELKCALIPKYQGAIWSINVKAPFVIIY